MPRPKARCSRAFADLGDSAVSRRSRSVRRSVIERVIKASTTSSTRPRLSAKQSSRSWPFRAAAARPNATLVHELVRLRPALVADCGYLQNLPVLCDQCHIFYMLWLLATLTRRCPYSKSRSVHTNAPLRSRRHVANSDQRDTVRWLVSAASDVVTQSLRACQSSLQLDSSRRLSRCSED